MSAAQAFWERRQFGRRESNIKGVATLSGRGSHRFTIQNISDGGALLVFESGVVPSGSFRIEVDGADFVLLCEVRHVGAAGVGISFLRASEGAALNRYFQLKPATCATGDSVLAATKTQPALPRASNRTLRAAFTPARTHQDPATPASMDGHERKSTEAPNPVATTQPLRANPWVGAALALQLHRLKANPDAMQPTSRDLTLYSHRLVA